MRGLTNPGRRKGKRQARKEVYGLRMGQAEATLRKRSLSSMELTWQLLEALQWERTLRGGRARELQRGGSSTEVLLPRTHPA